MQKQLVVSPMSATFEVIGKGKHFGQVACPFCNLPAVVLGPSQGKGLCWLNEACGHSIGIAAGAGYDITVLFNGQPHELYPHGG